jgi:hypothetical protein
VASLQLLVYDGVRFALGIGPDDLKLYLDVLGGALSEGGGPVLKRWRYKLGYQRYYRYYEMGILWLTS